jgi:hypothetical protein
VALEGYTVKPISGWMARVVVIEKHYLHRACPISYAFGLFNSDDTLMGVICYGTPSSAPLRAGICGPDEVDNVIELTRLWIDDSVPRNGESYLIGNTIRLVDKQIVVSFAEIGAGHVGTVYQATNWIYTGLSAKRTNWTIEGVNLHSQTLGDKFSADEIRSKFGDAFSLQDRPRKHRYIYFNADKRRKKELMAKLRYPILPYPKLNDGQVEYGVVSPGKMEVKELPLFAD